MNYENLAQRVAYACASFYSHLTGFKYYATNRGDLSLREIVAHLVTGEMIEPSSRVADF